MNVDYDKFIASCYNLQKNPVSLISMTPATQLSFIENIIFSDEYLIDLKEIIKMDIKKLSTDVASINSKMELINEDLDKENAKLHFDINDNDEDDSEIDTSLNTHDSILQESVEQSTILTESELEKTLRELKTTLKEKNKDLENKRLELSLQKSKQKEIEIVNEKITRYTMEIDLFKREREKINLIDEATFQKKTLKKERIISEIEKAKLFFSCLDDEESYNRDLEKHNNEIKIQKTNCSKNILTQDTIDDNLKTLKELKENNILYEKISQQIFEIKENKNEAMKKLKELFVLIQKTYSGDQSLKKCTSTNSMLEFLNAKLLFVTTEIKSISTILICPQCETECKLISIDGKDTLISATSETEINSKKKHKKKEKELKSLSELITEKVTLEEIIGKIKEEKRIVTIALPILPNIDPSKCITEISKLEHALKLHETSKARLTSLNEFPEIFRILQAKLNEKKKNLGEFSITKTDSEKLHVKLNNLSERLINYKNDKKKKSDLDSRIKNNEELLSSVRSGKKYFEISDKLMLDINKEINTILDETIIINTNISKLDSQLTKIKKKNQIIKQKEKLNELLHKKKQYENNLKKATSSLECYYKFGELVRKLK